MKLNSIQKTQLHEYSDFCNKIAGRATSQDFAALASCVGGICKLIADHDVLNLPTALALESKHNQKKAMARTKKAAKKKALAKHGTRKRR